MPSPAASTNSSKKLLRRFRRSRRGSVAVEFALVAPVFFALLFAIIEAAIVFFADQVLETIAENSARMVLTGQAQNAAYTQAQFKTYVCGQIPALFNCNNVYVDVESYAGVRQRDPQQPRSTAAAISSTTCSYSPGGAGNIVVVRLFYQWQLYVTGFGFNISNLNGNMRLLTGHGGVPERALLRAEPR